MVEYVSLSEEEQRMKKVNFIQKTNRKIKQLQLAIFVLAIDCIILTWMVLK